MVMCTGPDMFLCSTSSKVSVILLRHPSGPIKLYLHNLSGIVYKPCVNVHVL